MLTYSMFTSPILPSQRIIYDLRDQYLAIIFLVTILQTLLDNRDVTDSKSASESDGIRHFSQNPKSVGYLKSDRN